MLPIPIPPVMDDLGAGPSTPTVPRNIRRGGKRAAKEVTMGLDDEDGSPKKKAKGKATSGVE